MMGFDSYGYGACSSSSSNLSPLAPPFTVDRTDLNLDTNLCVNNNFIKPPPPFNELPPQPYIAPPPSPSYSGAGIYDSSLPSWGLHSNPTSIPVADYYTSFNSEADSVSTRVNYLAPVPPSNMTADDESGAFSYAPYTDSVKTAVDTAKPYYPSYVSPAFEKKESLARLGDSTYDFLSTCCLAPSGGTSQGDYTKKVSGWSCLNQWDDSWNGFKDLESDNYTDSKWDSSLYSNEKNAAGPPLCMDYVKPGPGATKYDEVKQSLFMRPPAIETIYSQLNMDLSHQNEEFSSKSDLVVDYPHLTLNSNKYEVGDNPSRYNLYPENIGRDEANTSLTGPHSSNKSLSKASEPHLRQMGSPNRYSLNLGEIKVNDSVGNSSKSLDPYNPAEDSPCWKGASSSRFSCFGGSRASALQPLPEKSPYVRDVSQEFGESFTSNPSKPMENSLSPTMMRTSFSTYSNRGGDGNFTSTKPEAFFPEQNCNWVFASPIKSPLEDGSLTSEKCATRSCLVEKEKNANESSGMVSLHVPNHNAYGDSSNLTNLNEEDSSPKIDLAAMIKTMHNLSDLILFYCSNDECALKEQENVALKHVISNLNSCMSKVPSSTLKRKSVLAADLHQDANVTNIAAANVIDNVDDHLAQDKKSRNMLPCTEDEECHDFCNVHNVSDIGKPDEMAQAIKKVLSEKFNGEEERLPQALLYKNLWLEAEAVICSTNFKTRFDRVKNEVEKSNPLKVKDGLQDMIDMEKSSHSEVYPDVKLVKHLNSGMTSSIKNSPMISISSPTDDVMARFRILKSRDDKSTSMSPTDYVKDFRSCASDASSIPDSPIRSTTNHEDDVIARLGILTSLGDSSVSMSTPQTIMHPISSMFSSLKDVNTLPTGTCIQGSPLSNNTRGSNDAVMARLRILNCRADKKDEYIDTQISHHPQNCIDEDKLNVNKIDLEMSFQSCNEEEVENQHSAGWYDGPSIDWELVLKDDFVWQK